jgi:hypothetical protein
MTDTELEQVKAEIENNKKQLTLIACNGVLRWMIHALSEAIGDRGAESASLDLMVALTKLDRMRRDLPKMTC